MVKGLLDTNIIVDFLRLYTPAQNWYQQQPTLGITPFVWLEVIEGSQNNLKQRHALKLMKKMTMIYPEKSDYDWAMQQLGSYWLSHHIELLDCLIASVSYRLQIMRVKRNLKHFKPLLGNLAQKPY